MDGFAFTFTSTDGNTGVPIVTEAGSGDTTIIGDGPIHIGDPLSNNNIYLNGAISVNHRILNTANVTETLDNTYYFVEVASATTTTIQLPAASSNPGRQYIIVNDKPSGSLTVVANGGDLIDDDATIVLDVVGMRVIITSTGTGNSWLVN